jgi:gas vesicle protein
MVLNDIKVLFTLKNVIMNIEAQELWEETNSSATGTGSNDLTKVLIGALAGAAAGALVGGLFTQKGVEIRNRVGEGSRSIANNIKDKASGITGSVADKFEATKEAAADWIAKGKQKIGMSSSNSAYKANTAYSTALEGDAKGAGSKILLGALIASVAGTIVWSFATEKGKETRHRVVEGSKNLTSNLKVKASEIAGGLKEGIANTYEAAKEGAIDLLEKEKQKIDALAAGNTGYSSPTGADKW